MLKIVNATISTGPLSREIELSFIKWTTEAWYEPKELIKRRAFPRLLLLGIIFWNSEVCAETEGTDPTTLVLWGLI